MFVNEDELIHLKAMPCQLTSDTPHAVTLTVCLVLNSCSDVWTRAMYITEGLAYQGHMVFLYSRIAELFKDKQSV